ARGRPGGGRDAHRHVPRVGCARRARLRRARRGRGRRRRGAARAHDDAGRVRARPVRRQAPRRGPRRGGRGIRERVLRGRRGRGRPVPRGLRRRGEPGRRRARGRVPRPRHVGDVRPRGAARRRALLPVGRRGPPVRAAAPRRMTTVPEPVTRLAAVLRADNPGPMTLDGTRSYVLRAPESASCVVVDPGPDDAAHLDALAAAGPVELVLVTHRHADHTAGSPGLRARTGAPVRAADPDHCHGGEPLRDGETIRAAGLRIEVLATPGHTADSVCLVLPDDDPGGTVLTGDTVLGTGTTVIAEPDGSLGDYLASLDALEAVATRAVPGPATGLPGHGPVVDDLGQRVRAYRAHRHE